MAESAFHVPVSDWLDVMRREYLDDYLRSGGSAVKVVTGSDETLGGAIADLKTQAEADGYYYAHLDPAERLADGKRPDLHRIDRFFFAATRAVDWKAWAANQARQYLAAHGIVLAEGRNLGDLEGIAEDNGRDPQDLLNQYQRELATPQIRDTRLTIEFRAAVTALGRSLLIPDAVAPTTEEVLLGWFAGRTMPGGLSALKKVGILERVNVTNARPLMGSFCRWLPQAGLSGLVVTLDFRPYEFKKLGRGRQREEKLNRLQEAIDRRVAWDELSQLAAPEIAAEPEVHYSDAAYMQMLTMIRRFIDEIDWFERFLLVIITSPDFYKDKSVDPTVKRCYFDYDALQTRIGQEVHDARYPNPAASLIRLGGATE